MCVKRPPIEAKYLHYVNKITETALKARHGQHYKFVPFNALSSMMYDCSVKAGYGFHSDLNVMHCSLGPDDDYPQDCIPKPENFVVWTSTFMREFVLGKPLQLTWVDDCNRCNVVASLNIPNDMLHLQADLVNMHGRQHGAKHNKNNKERFPTGNILRGIMTAQNLVIPGISERGYDKRVALGNFPSDSTVIQCNTNCMVSNPIALVENPAQDIYFSSNESGLENNNNQPTKESRELKVGGNSKNTNKSITIGKQDKYSDCWPQCTDNDYALHKLLKPDPYLTTREPASCMYARSTFHQELLKNRTLL